MRPAPEAGALSSELRGHRTVALYPCTDPGVNADASLCYNASALILEGIEQSEADLSAQEPPTQAGSRLPQEDGLERWAQCSQGAPPQGPAAAHRIGRQVGSGLAATRRRQRRILTTLGRSVASQGESAPARSGLSASLLSGTALGVAVGYPVLLSERSFIRTVRPGCRQENREGCTAEPGPPMHARMLSPTVADDRGRLGHHSRRPSADSRPGVGGCTRGGGDASGAESMPEGSLCEPVSDSDVADVGTDTPPLIRRVLVYPIRLYQRTARFRPAVCRYHPTCSEYMAQALLKHGPVRGLGLGLWRIVRCNPWAAGGEDPVP